MRGELKPRSGAFFWLRSPPRASGPLREALLQAFAAFGETPKTIFVGGRTLGFSAARLAKAMEDPRTLSVCVKGAGEAEVQVDLPLRAHPRRGWLELGHRYAELVTPVVAPGDERLVAFLAAVCAAYDVSHGGVLGATSVYGVSAEASLAGGGMIGDDQERRLAFDRACTRDGVGTLRRLYPVTIIGPAIWATLPPLPAVEPPLVVRELGDCKMVTAWPTLVDPHDPQFLLGTRELRRWLWPHTIGNPADDPHEVDIRLKWAELLPW